VFGQRHEPFALSAGHNHSDDSLHNLQILFLEGGVRRCCLSSLFKLKIVQKLKFVKRKIFASEFNEV
jgi:hypothetical protein